jgi:hypothetical protein
MQAKLAVDNLMKAGNRSRQLKVKDKQAGRQTGKQANRQAGKQANRQTGKQANRNAGKQANRQTDKQTKRQTGRHSSIAPMPCGTTNMFSS